MKIIDTHAHLNHETYLGNLDEELRKIRESGVEKVIIPTVLPQDFEQVLKICEEHDECFAGLGIQPEEVENAPADWESEIIKFAKHPKVVAIGEIGLDYYWIKDEKNHEIQKKFFETQILLANELGLPILVHDREAHADTFEMLKRLATKDIPVVMHCFSGSAEFAKQCVKRGMFLAFGGVTTFKNAKKAKEAVAATPLENLLLETDSPYMTPEPHRGKPNSPAYLKFVCEKIAEIKGETFDTIAKATTENAKRIFDFERHERR